MLFTHMVRTCRLDLPMDFYILHLFHQHDILLTPKVVALNTDYDQSYVGKRCRKLAEEGLLDRVDRGLFRLRDKGRRFVEGGLDASVLDEE